ncbi:hypothetical protein ACP70R_000322 [Stipagrostis hirtigluma subsp. patula]
MVVAKGCAADVMVLIITLQSSSSPLVVYTSLTDTAYLLHQREDCHQIGILESCCALRHLHRHRHAIVNVALMNQQAPWVSTSTECTWLKELVRGPPLLGNTVAAEVLRGALGAHHLTVLAEGSDPAQGSVEGRGPGQGIEGSDPAQGSAEGSGPAQGIEGSDHAQGTAEGIGLVQGIAEGIAHAQGIARAAHHMKEILSEGVWIGPGHQPAMGTTRQTSKPLPCDKLLFF